MCTRVYLNMKMAVGTAIIKLYAPWVHSLKEKRMIIRSITNKTKNHFNISINEVGEMDKHQIIIIGISCTSNSHTKARETIDRVVEFIESNTEAEVTDIEIDIL
jgi:uncharacterized protein YlxP (DUF503 family)